MSRHSPIVLKLDLGNLPVIKKIKAVNPKKPAWYKAEETHREEFTRSVHDRLSILKVPESLNCEDPHCQHGEHSDERDSLVIDIMSSVIESSHQCIPMSGGRRSTKPECPVEQAIPGWREMVKPYKKDAVFWHDVWQSADRPR